MKWWMKVLAVALAAVVGLAPVFGRISYAQTLPSPSIVLPVGDELEEEDLLKTEGEFWHAIVAFGFALLTAAATMIHEAFFDEERGFDRDDTSFIAGCTMFVLGFTWYVGSSIETLKAWYEVIIHMLK